MELNKIQAIELAKRGVKITHRFFDNSEWFSYNTLGKLVLEDGVVVPENEFWIYRQEVYWNDGYSIYGNLLLWIDDYRNPNEQSWLSYSPIDIPDNIVWVKTFEEFTQYIVNYPLPDGICFDHDLGEEKSGFDCAKYLVDYCMDRTLNLPLYGIQSANPVGKENIDKLFKNFIKKWKIVK